MQCSRMHSLPKAGMCLSEIILKSIFHSVQNKDRPIRTIPTMCIIGGYLSQAIGISLSYLILDEV